MCFFRYDLIKNDSNWLQHFKAGGHQYIWALNFEEYSKVFGDFLNCFVPAKNAQPIGNNYCSIM